MLNKPPLPFTKGLHLGNMPQIRTIVDEELENMSAQETRRRTGFRYNAGTSCCVASNNR